MFRKWKLFWVIAGVITAINIVACTEEEPTIGLQFIDHTSFELASIDTITLQMSTIFLDSVPTGNSDRLLLGRYDDLDFGLVKAEPYFNYESTITESNVAIKDVRYDSTVIRLIYDGYNYNDTTQTQTIRVYELAQEMAPNEGDNLYYNTSSFDIKYEDGVSTSIGELSLKPRPFSGEDVEIRVSDRLGLTIFNETFDSDTDESIEFSDLSYGFKIEADDDNTVILGLNANVEFIVYYTDFSSDLSQDKTIVFESSQSFTNMVVDYGNELIQSIVAADNGLHSVDTGHQAYIMGGVGMGIRIEMPYLRNILLDNPNIAIDNVWLSLKPALDKYNNNKALPTVLEYRVVDDDNDVIAQGETFPLFKDDEFDKETQYLFSIKQFVELQLSIQEDNHNAIFITLPTDSYYSSLENLVLGDTENDEYESNMMLNLIQVKND